MLLDSENKQTCMNCILLTDDVLFWRAIVQLGLVDEFFREVKAKLDVLKGEMVKNCVPLEGNCLRMFFVILLCSYSYVTDI